MLFSDNYDHQRYVEKFAPTTREMMFGVVDQKNAKCTIQEWRDELMIMLLKFCLKFLCSERHIRDERWWDAMRKCVDSLQDGVLKLPADKVWLKRCVDTQDQLIKLMHNMQQSIPQLDEQCVILAEMQHFNVKGVRRTWDKRPSRFSKEDYDSIWSARGALRTKLEEAGCLHDPTCMEFMLFMGRLDAIASEITATPLKTSQLKLGFFFQP